MQSLERDDYRFAPESGIYETLLPLGAEVTAGQPVGAIHFLERPDREPTVVDGQRGRRAAGLARTVARGPGRLRGLHCPRGRPQRVGVTVEVFGFSQQARAIAMLVGYVSDERYVALADVLVEFEAGAIRLRLVRSSPLASFWRRVRRRHARRVSRHAGPSRAMGPSA